jgi:hypothetical protein
LFGYPISLNCKLVIGGTISELEFVNGTDQSRPPFASNDRPKRFAVTTFAASAGLSLNDPVELGIGFGVGLFEAKTEGLDFGVLLGLFEARGTFGSIELISGLGDAVLTMLLELDPGDSKIFKNITLLRSKPIIKNKAIIEFPK